MRYSRTTMLTKRRQMRKRQTRRRRVSRRQVGGTVEEDYAIIRTIHRHISNPGKMIAAIYKTRALYAKIPDFPPGSAIGEGVIPKHYAKPYPSMKPLNSVIKGAYNFFKPYAGRARGSESGRAEWEMAKQINDKLSLAFLIFIGTNLRTVRERGVPHLVPASNTKLKQANKLFGEIANAVDASGIGGMEAMEASAAREEEYARGMKRHIRQQEENAARAEQERKNRYNEVTKLIGGPMNHEEIERVYLLEQRVAANKAAAAGGAGRAKQEPPVELDPNFFFPEGR